MPSVQTIKVEFQMVSLKWGDALSTMLPGSVALLALALLLKPPAWIANELLGEVNAAGGVALLVAAALCGAVLEGITRVLWEPKVLLKYQPAPSVLSQLTPENVALYERGVQSSYKWVTFHANAGTAFVLLTFAFAVRSDAMSPSIIVGSILGTGLIAIVLFRASYIQWGYYCNYMSKVFSSNGVRNADERSAGREPLAIDPRPTAKEDGTTGPRATGA